MRVLGDQASPSCLTAIFKKMDWLYWVGGEGRRAATRRKQSHGSPDAFVTWEMAVNWSDSTRLRDASILQLPEPRRAVDEAHIKP